MRRSGSRLLAQRVAALERAATSLERELRTRRLAVVDSDGDERVVAEVVDGHAEVRLSVPGAPRGQASSVLLFATPRGGELGTGVGIQLWGDGDAVLELCAWDVDGRWRVELRRQRPREARRGT
ncbi:MAG: hypothetical protein M0Z33_10395 [Actinomycetota bacterium]|nr:hypothetical protein [Actinomycetota bacterium]